MLERIDTIAALRERLERPSRTSAPREVNLVPTMGALHAGHAELIRRARAERGTLVVSIFVNAPQFNSPDDLVRYPRTMDSDLALCRELGADVVFAPASAEMYPEPLECRVEVGRLADHLCGPFRPGHFGAVATVVLKLFEIVRPQRAFFGEKDAQQLAIIRRLAADFNIPVTIVEVPTVREPDGLALSSRNLHLSGDERALAPSLYAALLEAARRIADGERDPGAVRAAAVARIPADERLRLEYLEIVDPASLQPVTDVSGPVRVAGAMWVGKTRLIDNLLVPPTTRHRPTTNRQP